MATSYSVDDDPWSANAFSRGHGGQSGSTSSNNRPLTWAAPGGGSNGASHRHSIAGAGGASGVPSSFHGHEDHIVRQLPAVFEDVFELCRHAEQSEELEMSLGQLGKVVRSAPGLGATDVEEIINLSCSSTSSHCSKEEYATALVLIAQRQKGQSLNVREAQAVLNDESEEIPVPRLDLSKLRSSAFVLRSSTGQGNGVGKGQNSSASASTASALDPWQSGGKNVLPPPAREGLPASSSVFRSSTLRAWDEDDENGSNPWPTSRPKSPLFSPVYVSPHPTSVHLLPDLGGFLFFRHVLYLVKTPTCAGVKRRYSDFVSLHDYLLARFPFRLLPPLPPKRLSLPHMNRTQAVGTSQQDSFLEQRRLALARYTRTIISHPVLRKDATVLSFFTSGAIKSSDYSVRRDERRASASQRAGEENASTWKGIQMDSAVVEEGLDDSWKLSEADIMHVPVDMDEKLKKTKELASTVMERWNGVVSVFERQVRRTEAMSAESTRLSLTLSSLLEVEEQTYQGSDADAEDGPGGDVMPGSSDTFHKSSTLLVSNSQDYADLATARFHALQHTLDALKNGRDVWVALRDLFKRHDKLGGDRIPEVEARIGTLRKRFKATQEEKKPGWQEQCARLKEEVERDQRLIERFTRRNQRVRVAIWHEVARMQTLKNQIVADWRSYAKNEAVHLAATRQAAEELALALEQL